MSQQHNSESLFKDILKEFKTKSQSEVLDFKGYWAFSYYKGANILKSESIKLIDENNTFINDNDNRKKVLDVRIDCDYGAIGHALKEMQKRKENVFYEEMKDTFNDPRGTVCYIDSQIEQQYALYILVKDNESNILGIYDLFFKKEKNVKHVQVINELEKIKKIFLEIFKGDSTDILKRLCKNTFIIKQYENLLDIGALEKDSLSPKENAVNKLENIISLTSKTPLFTISSSRANSAEQIVGLNFEFIGNLITNEYKFCCLIQKEDCPYHCKEPAEKLNKECSNDFLNNFFFNILRKLDSTFCSIQINIKDNVYTLSCYLKNNVIILDNKINNIQQKIERKLSIKYEHSFIKNYLSIDTDTDTFAKNKYKDEFIFHYIKDGLEKEYPNVIYAIILNRTKPKSLIYTKQCEDCKEGRKKLISPSEILYKTENWNESYNDFEQVDENRDNVVHFKILNEDIFKKELKKQISINKDRYFNILKPYLENNQESTGEKKQDDRLVKIKNVGENFFDKNNPEKNAYRSLINEQINLIESIFQQKETVISATRSAISQVMSRNMSHNIGSHVMSSLISKENCTTDKIKMLVEKVKSYKGEELKNGDKEYNAQLAYFNQYLKTRMDYLSEVTFGISNMQSSFRIYNDVFLELDKVRFLLNNISGINDFEYNFQFNYNSVNIVNNDIACAFPSDVLGVSAFFNILENIVRNTAKHAKDKYGKTTFSITFKDIDCKDFPIELSNQANLYYQVEITDGIAKVENIEVDKISDEDKKKYAEFIGIKEDKFNSIKFECISKIDWLVAQQNHKINQSVLRKDTNELRTEALGVLEMEASSAFLRQIDMPEIESDDYQILNDDNIFNRETNKFYILKAININGALGYRIFLQKPQEILFVGNWAEICEEKKNNLLNHGIWFKTEDEFINEIKDDKIFYHQFAIFYDIKNDEIKEIINKDNVEGQTLIYRNQLPKRLIEIKEDKNEIVGFLNDDKKDDLVKKIWELWLKRWGYYNNDKKEDQYFFSESIGQKRSDNKKKNIILHHGGSYNNAFQNNEIKDFINFIEPLSTFSLSKFPFYNFYSKLENYLQEYLYLNKEKFFEFIESKVIVIDERIQKFSIENDGEGNSNFKIFKHTNILIPEETKIQLDANIYDNKVKCDIIAFISNNIIERDFLLIHYGILERMYGSGNKEEINNKLLEWAKKINVVVTSGRGKQSLELPKYVSYINLSAVLNVFTVNRSKYLINRLLNQTRK